MRAATGVGRTGAAAVKRREAARASVGRAGAAALKRRESARASADRTGVTISPQLHAASARTNAPAQALSTASSPLSRRAAAPTAPRPLGRTAALRRALLDWYRRERRELPWRHDRAPYRGWLSEILCQQTRAEVAAVAFERFVLAFPDLDALARADEDAVLSLWSGLGYYSRARCLLRAAQSLRAAGHHNVPDDSTRLRALPGVGPYTAAAILSIAFGHPLAAVDGNVIRVVSRLARLDRPDARGEPHATLAQELLDPAHAGDWNQAMMELGARICTPRAPRCPACPIATACQARTAGNPLDHPPPKPRRAREIVGVEITVTTDPAGRLLLERGAFPLLRHLWLPPARLRSGDLSSYDFKHHILHRELRVTLRSQHTASRPHRAPRVGQASVIERRFFEPTALGRIGRSSLLAKALHHAALATHPEQG